MDMYLKVRFLVMNYLGLDMDPHLDVGGRTLASKLNTNRTFYGLLYINIMSTTHSPYNIIVYIKL